MLTRSYLSKKRNTEKQTKLFAVTEEIKLGVINFCNSAYSLAYMFNKLALKTRSFVEKRKIFRGCNSRKSYYFSLYIASCLDVLSLAMPIKVKFQRKMISFTFIRLLRSFSKKTYLEKNVSRKQQVFVKANNENNDNDNENNNNDNTLQFQIIGGES